MSKLILPAVASFILLCACSHTRTVTTQDGTVSIDTNSKDGGAVHITGKDGSSVDFNAGGKPIADYPGDVPLYQGKSLMDMKVEKKHSRVVSVQSSDPMDKITGFYKAQLESKGWKTDSSMQTGQMYMFTATKDERKLAVTVTSDGKLQTISQHVADQ